MPFNGLKTRTIFTVYQEYGNSGVWLDVCSFKSKLAAMGYIAFQKEMDSKNRERYPEDQDIAYKYEETLLHYED